MRIRRRGKSCPLLSTQDEPRDREVSERGIVYPDLGKRGMRRVGIPDQLDALIEKSVTDADYKYLLIDEAQNVEGFDSSTSESTSPPMRTIASATDPCSKTSSTTTRAQRAMR